MRRKMLFVCPAVCALALAGCSGSPETLMSPTGVTESATTLNPDGSNLKVTAPSGLTPNGGVLNTRRPTLSFTASTGVYQPITANTYDIEVQDAAGAVIYARLISGTSHTVDTDAPFATTLWWRTRLRMPDSQQFGPWSGFAQFRTPDPPASGPAPPTSTGGGSLQFPPPAACASGGIACVAAVAAQSDEWTACARGIGVGCHRFTRQVVAALSSFDPNWLMIQAAPGGHACNCSGCGPSDGTMFREDTTVYGGRDVFDMIVGAGGPSPSLTWSFVGAPRAVDVPNSAPVCR